MMMRSKNLLILLLVLLLGGVFVAGALYFYDVDPNSLIACPEEAAEEIEPCEDDLLEPLEPQEPQEPVIEPDLVACTADAMQCPDGSYVGRTGPDCAFAACPDISPVLQDVTSFEECDAAGNPVMESYPRQCVDNGELFVEEINKQVTLPKEPIGKSPIVCTEAMKQVESCTLEYIPVCGLIDVQCITTPCNPIPQTFSNGCHACGQGNVISYEMGECMNPDNV